MTLTEMFAQYPDGVSPLADNAGLSALSDATLTALIAASERAVTIRPVLSASERAIASRMSLYDEVMAGLTAEKADGKPTVH
ncbi:hypothetical protein [Pseudomonas sp. MPC6]|uniref:hypothetical protein n=1 Tax=unclassified Pseudomonas TaxID=196821 RepID=UPI0011102A77|nr:hypothetical protein [Pseudomonas sp. MPC6]QCY11127.1 hypothetical protein ELQ88_10035 [Pseudomonas sp. MPC6]